MKQRFEDKVVLITGGLGGLGYALGRAFYENGAHVALTDKTNPYASPPKYHKELERQVPYFEVKDGLISYFKADMTKPEEIKAAVSGTVEHYGKIDCLINCGAVGATLDAQMRHKLGRNPVCQSLMGGLDPDLMDRGFNEEDFNLVMDINCKAAILFTKNVVPHMPRSRESCIISITSEFMDGKMHYAVGYTASKAALCAVAMSWAYDPNILPRRSLVLSPGPVNAPMLWTNPKGGEEAAKGTTLKCYSEPEDIAVVAMAMLECTTWHADIARVDSGFYMRS